VKTVAELGTSEPISDMG